MWQNKSPNRCHATSFALIKHNPSKTVFIIIVIHHTWSGICTWPKLSQERSDHSTHLSTDPSTAAFTSDAPPSRNIGLTLNPSSVFGPFIFLRFDFLRFDFPRFDFLPFNFLPYAVDPFSGVPIKISGSFVISD